MRGSATSRMAGTAESSSVGTGRSQAEWAGGKPAERMVLGEPEGLKRAAKNTFRAFGETSWRKKCTCYAKIFKYMGGTSSRRYDWSRRQRVGILAMAPPRLEETPGKKHASHQGTFLFPLLEHLSREGRAGTTLGCADLVCLLPLSPKPWELSPRNLIPTQISIPSFKEAFLDPRSCSLCSSPIHTLRACSPCTIRLPVDSAWIPLSHA